MTNFVAPGTHLLIDFYGAQDLESSELIERALRDAAKACGATVLKVMLHHFGKGAGVTGVALLAESHMSIHTWPETGFAAIDIFLCGKCDPQMAVPILTGYFRPENIELSHNERGRKKHHGKARAVHP